MGTCLSFPLLPNHVSLSDVVLVLAKLLIFNTSYQAKIKMKIICLFEIKYIEDLIDCPNL